VNPRSESVRAAMKKLRKQHAAYLDPNAEGGGFDLVNAGEELLAALDKTDQPWCPSHAYYKPSCPKCVIELRADSRWKPTT
jgi:hypothetical protein